MHMCTNKSETSTTAHTSHDYGKNLTITNIDKYLKQYFSTKAYKILYLLCGPTYKDSKTYLFCFL